MRLTFFRGFALFATAGLLACVPLSAQSDDDAAYVAPQGSAPPVAPPLKKGSPLYHLANDPKLTSLSIGYREGDTSGAPYGIAHRGYDDMDGQGWGWIRKTGDDWSDAKWIALQETLGVAVAPRRKLASAEADLNWEFKFWGSFAGYKAYDPRTDEMLPVFILRGYEVLGPVNPLPNKIGPPDRVYSRRSNASSRENTPIPNNPGVD